jgi:hypothetical protein
MSTRFVFVTLFLAALLGSCAPSHPDSPRVISKEVGAPLKEAQTLIAAKNYKAALVKVNEAEAAKSTQVEAHVISEVRQYIEACENNGCPSQP